MDQKTVLLPFTEWMKREKKNACKLLFLISSDKSSFFSFMLGLCVLRYVCVFLFLFSSLSANSYTDTQRTKNVWFLGGRCVSRWNWFCVRVCVCVFVCCCVRSVRLSTMPYRYIYYFFYLLFKNCLYVYIGVVSWTDIVNARTRALACVCVNSFTIAFGCFLLNGVFHSLSFLLLFFFPFWFFDFSVSNGFTTIYTCNNNTLSNFEAKQYTHTHIYIR